MSPDFSFVPHAAQGQTHEFAAQGPGNRAAKRRLPHPRRADKAQNRSRHLGFELANAKELQNPFLDAFEPIVVRIQDLAGLMQIQSVLSGHTPRQFE